MNMNNDVVEFGSIMHRNLHRKKVGLGSVRFLSFLGMTMGVLILMAMAAPSARADLLTYYDFEDGNLTSDSPGLQTTNIAGVGFFTPFDFGSGTNLNAVTPSTNFEFFTEPFPGLPATSVSLGGLTTTGLMDVSISFALRSEGSHAYTTLELSYSTTGVNGTYTLFATDTTLLSNTNYTKLSFSPPAAVNGVSGSNLFFKFTFSGGTTVGGSNATDIDNIQITALPEPSSYIGGLLGLVGLCWYQRRRFARMFASRVKANSVVAV